MRFSWTIRARETSGGMDRKGPVSGSSRCRLALGCRKKEIGPELGIGDGTVHAHLHRVLQKLRVPNKKAALEEFFGLE